jgi:hypothetical protein
MNERIKLLAEQAGMRECSLGYGMPENVLWGENQIKNFAELIVQKCLEIMDDEDDYAIECSARMAARRVKKHFGVKE